MNHFFGIGIDRYSFINPLNNAVKDLNDVVDILVSKYDFEPPNVLTLTNENAQRVDIIENLERYRESISPDDNLLIYYSGHGYITNDRRGFWMPVDARKDLISTYIGNEIIQTYIRAIKSHHTLLISDSCFSGSLMSRGISSLDDVIEELDKRKSRWVFASGRDNEVVGDGLKGSNSPFAKALLTELRINDARFLSIQKLGVKVMESTRNNYKQLPEICPLFEAGDEGGQFIFRLKDTSLPNSVSVENGSDAKVDDDFEWYLALKSNKLKDYESYIIKFSNGKFTKEAIEQMLLLTNYSELKNISPPAHSQPEASPRSNMHSHLIFVFGNVNTGKTTIVAALLTHLQEVVSHRIMYNRHDETARLLHYFSKTLIDKEFPHRTMIGSPSEILLGIEPTNGRLRPVTLTILEMSGEELNQISPDQQNRLPSYIDKYLSQMGKTTFLLVSDSGMPNDDLLIASFVDFVLAKNGNLALISFILILSKWDYYYGRLTEIDFAKTLLPITYSKLVTSRCKFTIMQFSIGKVESGYILEEVDKKCAEPLWNNLKPLVFKKASYFDLIKVWTDSLFNEERHGFTPKP
jgi:hypothetical protein